MQLQSKKLFHAGDVGKGLEAGSSLQKIEITCLRLEVQNLVAVRKQPCSVVHWQFASMQDQHLGIEAG
jgi:hypothetical protein